MTKFVSIKQFGTTLCVSLILMAFLPGCNPKYANNGKEVTWNVNVEGSLNKFHVDADPNTFKALDDGYAVDKDFVFYEGRVVENADPKSLKVLGKTYAVDAKGVYCAGIYIDCIDPVSIRVHSYYLTEDKNDFFWNNKPLHVRDKSSFEVLDPDKGGGSFAKWAKDKYNAYFLPEGQVISGIDTPTFHQISAKNGSGEYAADRNRVYFGSKVVPDADPSTFAEVAFRIGQDKDRVYNGASPTRIKDYTSLTRIGNMYSDGVTVYDRDFEILPDADPTTFTCLYQNWYKDSRHVWWGNKVLPQADPQTFMPLEIYTYGESDGKDFNYGKDKYHVFFTDSIIEGADPVTFEKRVVNTGEGWVVFDRNKIYSGKDSPELQDYLKKKYGVHE